MGKRTNALAVAAVAGLARSECSGAGRYDGRTGGGREMLSRQWLRWNASCAVKGEDLAAVKTLLGTKAYKARFGKSTEHSCKAHGSCGASSHILNWTTTDEGTCQQGHGIAIEESDGKKVAKQL